MKLKALHWSHNYSDEVLLNNWMKGRQNEND